MGTYNKKTWISGEIIDQDSLNDIENQLAKLSNGTAGTILYDTQQSISKENAQQARSNIGAASAQDFIQINETQPVSTENKIWIDNSEQDSYEVPLVSEFDDIRHGIAIDFNEEEEYTSGTYVWKDNHMYRFIKDHSGAWVDGDVKQVDFATEISYDTNTLYGGYIKIAVPRIQVGWRWAPTYVNKTTQLVYATDSNYISPSELIDISFLEEGTPIYVKTSLVNDHGVFITDKTKTIITSLLGTANPTKPSSYPRIEHDYVASNTPQVVQIIKPEGGFYLSFDIREGGNAHHFTNNDDFAVYGFTKGLTQRNIYLQNTVDRYMNEVNTTMAKQNEDISVLLDRYEVPFLGTKEDGTVYINRIGDSIKEDTQTVVIKEGKYVLRTGSIASNRSSFATDFIPVHPLSYITLNGVYLDGIRSLMGYSSKMTSAPVVRSLYNSTDTVYNYTFQVPKDIKYIKVTGKTGEAISGVELVRMEELVNEMNTYTNSLNKVSTTVEDHTTAIEQHNTIINQVQDNLIKKPYDTSTFNLQHSDGRYGDVLMTLGDGNTSWVSLADKIASWNQNNTDIITHIIEQADGATTINITDNILKNNSITWEKYEEDTLRQIVKTYCTFAGNGENAKNDATLIAGMKIRTLGYYEPGDGGDAFYIIYNAPLNGTFEDNAYYEPIANNLYAKLIIGNYVTPEMFGAYHDGVHDDTEAFMLAVGNGVMTKNTTGTFVQFYDNEVTVVDPDDITQTKTQTVTTYVEEQQAAWAADGLGKAPVIGKNTYFLSAAWDETVVNENTGTTSIVHHPYILSIDNATIHANLQLRGILELKNNCDISGHITNIATNSLKRNRILIDVIGTNNTIHNTVFDGTIDAWSKQGTLATAGVAVVVYSGSTHTKIKDCTFKPWFKEDIAVGGDDVEISGCNFEEHVTTATETQQISPQVDYNNAIKLTMHLDSTTANGENIIIRNCYFAPHTDNPVDAYTGASKVLIDGCIFNCPERRCIEIKSKPQNDFIIGDFIINNCIMKGKGIVYAYATKPEEITNLDTSLHNIMISNCLCFSTGGTGAFILGPFGICSITNCYIDAGSNPDVALNNAFSSPYDIILTGVNLINAVSLFTATEFPTAQRIINGCYFNVQSLGVIPQNSDWHINNSIIHTTETPFKSVAGKLSLMNSTVTTDDVNIILLGKKPVSTPVQQNNIESETNKVEESNNEGDEDGTSEVTPEGSEQDVTDDGEEGETNDTLSVFFVGNTLRSTGAVFAYTSGLTEATFVPQKIVAAFNDINGHNLSTFTESIIKQEVINF